MIQKKSPLECVFLPWCFTDKIITHNLLLYAGLGDPTLWSAKGKRNTEGVEYRLYYFFFFLVQNNIKFTEKVVRILQSLFLLNYLGINCQHDVPSSLNTQVHISYKKEDFLYNHNMTIKVRKLIVIHSHCIKHRPTELLSTMPVIPFMARESSPRSLIAI